MIGPWSKSWARTGPFISGPFQRPGSAVGSGEGLWHDFCGLGDTPAGLLQDAPVPLAGDSRVFAAIVSATDSLEASSTCRSCRYADGPIIDLSSDRISLEGLCARLASSVSSG